MSLFVFLLIVFTGFFAEPAQGSSQITMTVIYDNYIFKEGTMSDWGFACFIEGTEKTILFDTGSQGRILLQNIDTLKIDLDSLDLIVISHSHFDHIGGLNSILERKSNVSVYFGTSFPETFSQNITNKGAIPVRVDEPVEICKHVYSTGEMHGPVNEQSLILDTYDGLVIITGCSHPGIVNILKKAKEILNKDIYLVFGGFHLLSHSETGINQIIQEFKALGVKKCGATHCTGDRAIALFKEAYGEDYIPMGVGQVIQVSTDAGQVRDSDNRQSHILNQFKLDQNFPDPLNGETVIKYHVPIQSYVN